MLDLQQAAVPRFGGTSGIEPSFQAWKASGPIVENAGFSSIVNKTYLTTRPLTRVSTNVCRGFVL
jgi:hypothetical protein